MSRHETLYIHAVFVSPEINRESVILNWEEDLVNRAASCSLAEMTVRESTISFEDVVNIQFTSGTTSFPKGVVLTHHGTLNNAMYVG